MSNGLDTTLEPAAYSRYSNHDLQIQHSIAISLKRIADSLEKPVTHQHIPYEQIMADAINHGIGSMKTEIKT